MTEAEKRESMIQVLRRFETAANGARELLKCVHGAAVGEKIRYAETFEQSPYSRVVSPEDFQKLLEP
jgi:methyl coenzyme M reductase gamma subunit